MIELSAFRARIGTFVASVPTRVERTWRRREKAKKNKRRYGSMDWLPFLCVCVMLGLFVTFNHVATSGCSAELQVDTVLSPCSAYMDVMLTNKGAHCYNGNGVSSPAVKAKQKRCRPADQPSVMSMFSPKRSRVLDPVPAIDPVLIVPTQTHIEPSLHEQHDAIPEMSNSTRADATEVQSESSHVVEDPVPAIDPVLIVPTQTHIEPSLHEHVVEDPVPAIDPVLIVPTQTHIEPSLHEHVVEDPVPAIDPVLIVPTQTHIEPSLHEQHDAIPEMSNSTRADATEVQSESSQTTTTESKKKKNYSCTYATIQKSFQKYPELKSWCLKSKEGHTYIYCSLCDCNVKIASRGTMDVLRLEKKTMRDTTPQINTHFNTPANATLKAKIATAECIWAKAVAEHNLSFRVSDCLTKAMRSMFVDSEIVKHFTCGKTKVKSILTQAIAPELEKNLVDKMRTQKFALLTDDTTDVTTKQQCCVLVRLFDETAGCVRGYVFKVLHLTSATGESIFKAITSALKKVKVPIENVFALGTDGANTMIGKEKGLFGRFRKVQGKIISMWCIAHRIHIVAKKTVSPMPQDVHDLPVLLYYWFKKSSKRQCGLVKMQEFCGVVQHKLLKPSDTRWLAMQQISERLSEQWEPLRCYFNSLPEEHELDENGKKLYKLDRNTKEKISKIKAILNNDRNLLCYLFLKDFLLKFTTFNKFFQCTTSVAYLMISKMNLLYKDVLNCFVKPGCINSSKHDLPSINTEDVCNILDIDSVWFGDPKTFDICGKLKDNGEGHVVKEFQSLVMEVYQRAIKELKKLPFHDKLLNNIQVLNPKHQSKESVRGTFMQLGRDFPNVIDSEELGSLDLELRNYDTYDMPYDISKMDVVNYWIEVGKLSDSVVKTFPTLYKLVQALLIIPHGNAESEQLFSRLKLLKTKFKSHMSGETLNAVLAVNFNSEQKCYEFRPTAKMVELSQKAVLLQKQAVANASDSDSDFVDNVTSPPMQKRKRRRVCNSDFIYE